MGLLRSPKLGTHHVIAWLPSQEYTPIRNVIFWAGFCSLVALVHQMSLLTVEGDCSVTQYPTVALGG
jgi:hypothetical protein